MQVDLDERRIVLTLAIGAVDGEELPEAPRSIAWVLGRLWISVRLLRLLRLLLRRR